VRVPFHIIYHSFIPLTPFPLPPGFANYAGTPPSSLNADITCLYRAITTNEETVASLCQRQEDLMRESKTELHMKQELEWEVKRLQESLAFHLREIKNIEIREELRQFQLRELNDLGTVTLVQALREETPEEFRTEARNDEESLGGGGERSRNWES
jgi:predicted RNase H-like nuclease (RuvC/YqgF family)